MKTETLILILFAAVVLIGVVVLIANRRKGSQKLRQKFGPEYDYTMDKVGDKHAVESTLKERENRVTKLNILALEETKKVRYQAEWQKIQADFVDNPSKSVEEANRLITEVMIARGFPVADFEQRAADLSVMFPDFVPNYRSAQVIALKNQSNGASTEELRQAMVYYHSLYEELLGTVEAKEVKTHEMEIKTQ